MGVVDRFNKRIDELEKAIYPTIQTTVNQNKRLLIYYQTGEQLSKKGEDQKGFRLVPSYAESTKKYKKSKGQKTSIVTLRDSGDMYRSVSVEAHESYFKMLVDVPYFEYLQKHYVSQILGIQQSNLNKFVENEVLPNLKQEFKKIIKK